MLLPGHLAGGYLATLALVKLTNSGLDQSQINHLLILGAIAGAIPDWDHIVSFIQTKAIQLPKDERHSHRNLFTHTPLFWLFISVVVYLLTQNLAFGSYFALTVLVGSWSHFFLDTFVHGIQWLWPFSRKKYAFLDQGVRPDYEEPRFWAYWWKFLKWYTRFLCFYLEVLITIVALIVLISSNVYG